MRPHQTYWRKMPTGMNRRDMASARLTRNMLFRRDILNSRLTRDAAFPCVCERQKEEEVKRMKALLVALNAKYIHSNLGIYCLYAYSRKQGISSEELTFREFTINQNRESIIENIYEEKPDVIGFSCYIWNIEEMRGIAREVKKILPQADLWFGGPEVSYDGERVLRENPWIAGVMVGAGERSFYEILSGYRQGRREWSRIPGLVVRKADGIFRTTEGSPLPMDEIPFVYDYVSEMDHRIIYYETSRGCPYGCSYCLSSVSRGVCFRSMALVERELQYFLDRRVPQVKFVDRTFNCNPEHAMGIWRFIHEHDNGVTNFHFELSADLLTREQMDYVAKFRPGLAQFEVGVQSTHRKTMEAIHRRTDWEKLKNHVVQVGRMGNVHQHLDLIAGLPHEDFQTFRQSFCDVYALGPDQLQLGFLKVLKGSPLEGRAEEFGMVCQSQPPYEILGTKWISYGELRRLKWVEDMVERYYNSMQFMASVKYLVPFFQDAFAFYDLLGQFYKKMGYGQRQQSRMQNYDNLLEFVQYYIEGNQNCGIDPEAVRELLVFDLYARENLKAEPLQLLSEFQKSVNRKGIRDFYQDGEAMKRYLPEYEGIPWKQKMRMTHLRWFSYDILGFLEHGCWQEKPCAILFDYGKRNPLNHQAFCQSAFMG